MATATLVPSRSSFRIPPEISLDNNNFYIGPPRKSTASPRHCTVTASEEGASSAPQKKHKIPRFPPRNNPRAYRAWLISDPDHDYENDYNKDDEDDDEDVYGDAYERGSSQADPIVVEDSTADLDLEAEGDGAGNNTGNEAGKVGDQLTPHELGDGNDRSDEDDEGEELPSLEELEDLFGASVYNHVKLTAEDVNGMDSLAERIDVTTVPRARQKLETYVVANQESSIADKADDIDNPLVGKEGNHGKESTGGELSSALRKRKLDQLERDSVINHNSNNSAKDSSGGGKGGEGGDSPRPQKQQRPPASREDLPSSPPVPVLDLDSQCPQVDQQVVSTPRPASPSFQEPTLLHTIKPPYDEASSHIHNEGEDGNSDGVADNQSDVLNPEPTVKRRTRAKKDKINEINLDDEWEIDDILGERMTKSGRKYKVAWKPT